jgi:hypothetical protein
MPGQKEIEVVSPEDPANPMIAVAHGSCAVSKVAGPKFGTAKAANIFELVIPYPMGTSDLFRAFARAEAKVFADDLFRKAVLSISIGSKYINPCVGRLGLTLTLVPGDDPPHLVAAMRDYMDRFISHDIPIVAASGNTRNVRVFQFKEG